MDLNFVFLLNVRNLRFLGRCFRRNWRCFIQPYFGMAGRNCKRRNFLSVGISFLSFFFSWASLSTPMSLKDMLFRVGDCTHFFFNTNPYPTQLKTLTLTSTITQPLLNRPFANRGSHLPRSREKMCIPFFIIWTGCEISL